MLFMDLKRKGDVTISTVILIVLGLAVLVMLILGFTKGTDFLFSWFDKAPGEIQQIAKACVGYAQGSFTIDFCTYRKAGNELVNCNDDRIRAALKEEGVTVSSSLFSCSKNDAQFRQSACESVPENKRATTRINGAAFCAGVNSIVLSTDVLEIDEGTDGKFTVKLSAQPSAEVKVTVSSSNFKVTPEPTSLTFSTQDWPTSKEVTVTSTINSVTGDTDVVLSVSAEGLGTKSVTVTVKNVD